jgi:hypothetical protein
MALLNTWASQQDPSTLSPLDRLLNNYIQKSDAPAAFLMRGDPQGLLADINTPKPVNMAQDMNNLALGMIGSVNPVGKTAQELAHGLAQKNAVEMLGLHPNNTAIERAKALGFNVNEPVYHGTTHEFTQFGGKLHNPEGHLGAGHYFTTSPADASINYANLNSPDLSNRIEKTTEDILSHNDIYDWSTGDKNYNKAFEQAKKQIAGQNEGNIIPAYLKSKSLLDISPESNTWLDFTPKYNKQGDFVKDNPNTIKLYKSLQKQGKTYNFNPDNVMADLELYDQVNAHDLDKALRNSEPLMYAEHPRTGALAGNEVLRNIYKDLGYDTVKMNANAAFPKMFEQIPEDVSHIIVNKPNQIRSPFAAFDPARANEPDLLAGAMALPVSGLLSEPKKKKQQ